MMVVPFWESLWMQQYRMGCLGLFCCGSLTMLSGEIFDHTNFWSGVPWTGVRRGRISVIFYSNLDLWVWSVDIYHENPTFWGSSTLQHGTGNRLTTSSFLIFIINSVFFTCFWSTRFCWSLAYQLFEYFECTPSKINMYTKKGPF